MIPNLSTLIIAEAGVNHNGSLKIAKNLIDIASSAGADIVKFQTFKTEDIVIKEAKKANYQSKNTSTDETQYQMLKNLDLSYEEFAILKLYCDEKDIEFLSTAFDFDSLDFLVNLGIKRIKIPSGEITNLPYLRKASTYSLPIILSTGLSNLEEVGEAINIIIQSGLDKNNITILHCTSDYPAPLESVNLNAMKTIEKEFGVRIGYSDHTNNLEVAVAAVSLGASVIEKHFTISKDNIGPDHKASLEPMELEQMISSIRNIEIAMGSKEKKPSESELQNLDVIRRSIVAKKVIKRGDLLTVHNIMTKRPGSGVSPMHWDQMIGTEATRDYEKDEFIEK